jgi:23S rRNA-/tRNA-specific pseudouridylate synthase
MPPTVPVDSVENLPLLQPSPPIVKKPRLGDDPAQPHGRSGSSEGSGRPIDCPGEPAASSTCHQDPPPFPYASCIRPLTVSGQPVFHDGKKVLLREIEPYVYEFTTHVKQRWINQTVLQVYVSEFGSTYGSTENATLYFEAAIKQERLQVLATATASNKANGQLWKDPVDEQPQQYRLPAKKDKQKQLPRILLTPDQCLSYTLQSGDVVIHKLHRHEPAVMIENYHKISGEINSSDAKQIVRIIADTNELLVVDKPSTLPVHPCGAYHYNSLVKILEDQSNHQILPIHRLDRLTSGLVLFGKTREAVARWTRALQPHRSHSSDCTDELASEACQKLYLARVRGRFPMAAAAAHSKDMPSCPSPLWVTLPSSPMPVRGEWLQSESPCRESGNQKDIESNRTNGAHLSQRVAMLRKRNAHGYWITDSYGSLVGMEEKERGSSMTGNAENESTSSHSPAFSLLVNMTSNLGLDGRYTTAKDRLEALAQADTNHKASSEPGGPSVSRLSKQLLWFHLACPVRVVEPKNG